MTDLNTLSLDDLFAAGLKEIRKQAAEKAAVAKAPRRVGEPKPQSTLQLYADPANWTPVRAVAIIHSDSNTLLGQFTEYRHRSEVGTTKLVREDLGLPVSDTLRVSGSWWLGEERRPEPLRLATERRTVIMHLRLDELRVHSPAVELNVLLHYGAIDRVELALDTVFAGEKPETLLTLKAGTNIRELLSLDQRVALKEEAGV